MLGSIKEMLTAAFGRLKAKQCAEKAAECLAPEALEERAQSYRDSIAALKDALTAELCSAIEAGKSRIEIGVWDRPYRLETRQKPAKFIVYAEKKVSCLVPIFERAAQEDAMDECCDALKAFLSQECEGVVDLVRENLLTRIVEPPPEKWPRNERLALEWRPLRVVMP